MNEKNAVTISWLKAHLSEVLGRVRRGAVVTVLDRRTAIAKISAIEPDRLRIVRAPKGKFSMPKLAPVKVKGDVVQMLLEDRARR